MPSERKAVNFILEKFGKSPKIEYEVGDLERIKSYHEYRLKSESKSFAIDDITWNDLNMDDLFKRLNLGLSTSGEQYLYHQLRTPARDEETYNERKRMIETFEEEIDFRKSVHKILYRLGKNRKVKIGEIFNPKESNRLWLLISIILALGFIASAILVAYSWDYLIALFGFIIVNSLVREFRKKKIYQDLETLNYAVSIVNAAKKISKLKANSLDDIKTSLKQSLKRLKIIKRVGNLSVASGSDAGDVISNWMLLDLISYELLKSAVAKEYDTIFKIHETMGKVEAAVAVASFRSSVSYYSTPDIDFNRNANPFISCKDLVHPLIEECIPNDFEFYKSHLISGSNASGKSTFIKTIALNAILAQSVCTVLAKDYKSSFFKIYSSMALNDNVLEGESYYIAEIKSLKRIVDSLQSEGSVLCFVDEVLRGTNTVERISASNEILKYISEQGALSLVATHDMELCSLLQNQYEMIHFQESFADDQMIFDYKLKKGHAISRNAIKLLGVMGFPNEIVKAAEFRADAYETFSG